MGFPFNLFSLSVRMQVLDLLCFGQQDVLGQSISKRACSSVSHTGGRTRDVKAQKKARKTQKKWFFQFFP